VNISGDLFAEMRATITEKVPSAERQATLAKVDELEHAKGKPSFLDRYKAFVAVAANPMTVLQPFILPLTQLIGS